MESLDMSVAPFPDKGENIFSMTTGNRTREFNCEDDINEASENRFQFGKNWRRFHYLVNEQRILDAERSLLNMLGPDDFKGKSFLDIGSGSGLFSLAASRLGASVRSFDYDHDAVKCTREIRRKYGSDAMPWTIEWGDVLDRSYLESLDQFDIVYSWGVLHHTGDMWKALENIIPLCKTGGKVYIAIYNHQRILSKFWTFVKRTYNRNVFLKYFYVVFFSFYFILRGLAADLMERRNPLRRYLYESEKVQRGMSIFIDWIDWIGGYPFETAKPEEIFSFYHDRGFNLTKLVTCGGNSGINEFVFERSIFARAIG